MSSNCMPSVTVDTFCKIVEMQFREGNMRPIFGLGKGGIGKTESLEHLAKDVLGVGYIDIRLLLYSETDLKGIPYPNSTNTKTIWLQNNILPTIEKDGEKGILVLDEITSSTKSVRTAAYQLLNERRLGEYELPKGWLVVCLGNGEEDGGDYQGMEGNFANRCSLYNVIADVESWKSWAFENGVNSLVTGYVSFKPHDLHTYNIDDEEGSLLFASPRSWKAVSDILNTNNFREDDNILAYRIIANLGQKVGRQFLSFCKYSKQTVDPNTIIIDREKPIIESQEVIYITIQSVIKIIGDKIREDRQTLNGAVQQNTIQMLANGLSWILSLRKEYAVMGFTDLIAYEPDTIRRLLLTPQLLQSCPEFRQFANDNQVIFS